MLKSRTFVKKSRSGGVMKVVREHYLRDDIGCGWAPCVACAAYTGTARAAVGDDGGTRTGVLEARPGARSGLCDCGPHVVVPDSNVVLHQIDLLEDPSLLNVVILQTVLQEIRHRSAPVYKRLRDIIATPEKHFYAFTNEHHRETYVEQDKGESANDRNDRAIREAARWYGRHLAAAAQAASKGGDDGHVEPPKVLLVTNDRENREKARAEGLLAYTVEEYVRSLLDNPELIDRLALASEQDVVESRVIFPEHLPLSQLQQGVRSGRFVQGAFVASRENYLEGTVRVRGGDGAGGGDKEVLIQGLQHLNRAMHDDVVCVEMLPEERWAAPSSLVLHDEGPAGDVAEEKDDDEAVAAAALQAQGGKTRRPTGKVVGIVKRNSRPLCGMLNPSPIKEAIRHLFTPADRRMPRVRVETRQASSLQGHRIVVAIDGWLRNSRYPNGHFVRSLGECGDKETETEVLLLEHDVPHQPFSQAVLACLPSPAFAIGAEHEADREDLRALSICSVDPPGCTDIDDALHYRPLDNRNVEVGVHIADVSYFIRPGNALDDEAALRGTTVYLCEKRIDMVPELLSSNLCSLRSNVDRLAFSCIWEMTPEAKIVNTRFTKSIINSKASLTYAEAQLMMDDGGRTDAVTSSLRGLNSLAKILKQRRVENGALTLASPEVRFHMDSETHDPIDLQAKELKETNSMVEEFMLLANISVAGRIVAEFPECALLRRHPAPPPSNYDILVKAAKSKDIEIRVDSAKALAESLDRAAVPGAPPYLNTLLRILATRCMMQAVYFCSGMEPDTHHYGLATAIYTHFTSPIRRYSDVIVHRLLAVCVGADPTYPALTDKHKQQQLCNNLNFRHKMSQYAQRSSVAFHTQLFFKSKGVVSEEGFVLFVRKNAVVVLIPKYGLEGTVFFDSKDLKLNITFNEEGPTLCVEGVTLCMFDRVCVRVSLDASNLQHQRIRMHLVRPEIPGYNPPEVTPWDSEAPRTKKSKQR